MTSLRVLLGVILSTSHFFTSISAQAVQLHVTDRELFNRAGFFDYGHLYRGGVPQLRLSRQTLQFTCTQECSATSCGLVGAQPVSGAFCSKWRVVESGDGLYSYGTCECTTRGTSFCASYVCQQTETLVSDSTGFDNTFGKIKTCECSTAWNNASLSSYCHDWTCLGFGDGPVKTAYWHCQTPISQIPSFAGMYSKDFCWLFYSDQYSDAVAETNDCQCSTTSSSGTYCARWMCYQRIVKRWIWYSSLIASPLAALLNLWVPFAMRQLEGEAVAQFFLGMWILVTYVLIVMLGGIPSLLANTAALAMMFVVVNRSNQWGTKAAAIHQGSSTSYVSNSIPCSVCGRAAVSERTSEE